MFFLPIKKNEHDCLFSARDRLMLHAGESSDAEKLGNSGVSQSKVPLVFFPCV